MNAIKFIKEHGVEKAREELKKLPNSNVTHMTDDARMFVDENNPLLDKFQRSQIKDLICISELKRLVESVYLVKEHYTLDRAKIYAASPYTAPEIKERLEQAIADYESIESCKCVVTRTYENGTCNKCGMQDMGDDSHIENHVSPNCKKFDERVNGNETN